MAAFVSSPSSTDARPRAQQPRAATANPGAAAREAAPSTGASRAPESAEDVGLYGPGSEAWRMSREAMLLLGAGPRALLMQLAHPLVAEGVDQHSNFREDPWRRLSSTLSSYLTIVYGSRSAALGEIRRLNSLHRGIAGPVRDRALHERHGASYTARDPELSLWVHATLIDSTIVAVDRWLEPLPRERRRQVYAETRPIGLAFGIPGGLLPADLDEFEAYVDRMIAPDGPVKVSPTARALVPYILKPPIGPVVPFLGWLPPPVYSWTLWPAVGLLPEPVRDGYALRWRPLERAVSAWLVAGFRFWRPWFPTSLRWMPQAVAADRRVAGVAVAAPTGRQ
jgi:uncharacterized protein (DUF2236 family)